MSDIPSLYSETIRKARKTYRCGECFSHIHIGDRYYDINGIWEGTFSRLKFHIDCHEFRELLNDTRNKLWYDTIELGGLSEAIECITEDGFTDQWRDEHGVWSLRKGTVSEMKVKYEYSLL